MAPQNGILTEADTCRELVTPKLIEAGWNTGDHLIGEQRTFTNGRIIVSGGKVRRGQQRRADYILCNAVPTTSFTTSATMPWPWSRPKRAW